MATWEVTQLFVEKKIYVKNAENFVDQVQFIFIVNNNKRNSIDFIIFYYTPNFPSFFYACSKTTKPSDLWTITMFYSKKGDIKT
jgi:hypothetical protein